MPFFAEGTFREQLEAARSAGLEVCRNGRTVVSPEELANSWLNELLVSVFITACEPVVTGTLGELMAEFPERELNAGHDFEIPPETGEGPDHFNPEWLRGAARLYYKKIQEQLEGSSWIIDFRKLIPGRWVLVIGFPVPDDLRTQEN